MTNESTIRYELLRSNGLYTVTGEPVEIPNDVGATFGIHMNRYCPDGHAEKWAVTHLASGVAAGFGPSREAAIADATQRLTQSANRLREMFDKAVREREEVKRACDQLRQNERDILRRPRA